MLKLDSVSKRFDGLVALSDVSLRLGEKGIYGLIGPNGAGKTTLFNLLAGFLAPTSGRIVFDGHDLTNSKPYQIARLGVARTYQNIRLFPTMTVLENVLVAQNQRMGLLASFLALNRRLDRKLRDEADGLLRQMGLWNKRHAGATDLAYGEQRRLEIARALATRPRLLLLDEPAAGMNSVETEDLLARLESLAFDGIVILLVEHDMNVVMSACEHVFVLNFGHLIAEGTPAEIQANEQVIEAYLGRDDD
jgi:branched-chain amino acid transport system ATP-binding protein